MSGRAELGQLAGGGAITLAAVACLAASLGGTGALPLDWGEAVLAGLAAALALSLAGARAGERPGAWYAGVARGLERPGRPAWAIRVAVLATAPVAGLGVAAYACAALLTTLTAPAVASRRTDGIRVAATGFLGLAVVLAAKAAGVAVGGAGLLWACLLIGAGLPLFWVAGRPRQRGRAAPDEEAGVLTGLGLLLAAAGAGWVLSRTGLFRQAEGTIAGTAIAVAVVALVVGPRWLRTSRMLAVERSARARAQERAEMADHLHDSVLQTLALIQRRSHDAAVVEGLARRQERELRAWLFGRGPERGILTLADALRAVAAEIEDAHGIEVSVVIVGDAAVDQPARALLAAVREALTNAALHAEGAPIAVFARAEPGGLHVFVHDRGPGFDLDAIPPERRGVRESIVARMERHGGRADIRTAPGEGCEVALHLERT